MRYSKILVIIGIIFFLFQSNGLAIDAEIKRVELDETRNLYRVVVEYNVGGVKIENPYYVSINKIMDMTIADFNDWLKANIEYQCGNYIRSEFFKANTNFPAQLNNLIGIKYKKIETKIEYDYDGDSNIDKEYTIKEDGTFTDTTP